LAIKKFAQTLNADGDLNANSRRALKYEVMNFYHFLMLYQMLMYSWNIRWNFKLFYLIANDSKG